jgi:DNA polymerase III subunit delta
MVGRIKELAREEGAQISNPAAVLLASLVGGNPRHAHQEIRKLMAYVNYRRPIEEEDVGAIIADQNLGDIFILVDAIGKREGNKASKMFHRLLATQDAQSIFLMVVRQFRLLIMLKDYLERGGSLSSAPKDLAQPFFVIDKLKPQLGYFDLPGLEKIYRRLLEIDEAAKKGEMEVDIALDALIAGITR